MKDSSDNNDRNTTVWFRTTKYSFNIEEVHVTRDTEKCVWVQTSHWRKREMRINKNSEYADYWRTREEATSHLVERAERKLHAAEKTASECRAFLLANARIES